MGVEVKFDKVFEEDKLSASGSSCFSLGYVFIFGLHNHSQFVKRQRLKCLVQDEVHIM